MTKLKTMSGNFTAAVVVPPLGIAILAIALQQFPRLDVLGDNISVLLGALLALSLTIITGFRWHQTGKPPAVWLLLLLGSWVWVAAEFVDFDDHPNLGLMSDNVVPLCAWALTAATILPALMRDDLKRFTKILLALGLLFQSIAFIANMGDGSAFQMPHTTVTEMLKVDESFEALSLATYISGLLFILTVIILETPGSTGGALWDIMNSTPGRLIAIIDEDVSWLFWRLSNPNAPFSKFYADSIERKLDRGRPHRTLGQYTFSRASAFISQGDRADQFSKEGLEKYNYLKKYVSSPDATIVDYGCGSLRIGQHFIRSQAPLRFWGLDVTDRFYEDGLSLIGSELVAAKQPLLRKIDAKSLSEARSALPDFVYSVAVMKHVPRSELEIFWSNALGLLGPDSTAIIYGDISETEVRTAAKNWAYPQSDILAIIKRVAPDATIDVEILGHPRYFAGKRFDPSRFIVTLGQ